MAYSSYVQRDRLNKFYDRKKVQSKYKRACRFEARSAGDSEKSSDFSRSLLQGTDDWEDEYERRLSLSYGAPSANHTVGRQDDVTKKFTTVEIERPRKKRRSKDSGAEATQAAPEVVAAEEEEQALRSRRRKKVSSDTKVLKSANASTGEDQASSGAKPAPSKDGGNLNKKKKKGDPKKPWEIALPDRFSKDLKEFREKREAAEKEQQRRRDEELARKHQRKDSARSRAMKGQLVNQRTSRGQPKMQGMLEAITGKLTGEQQQKPSGHRGGFGRR